MTAEQIKEYGGWISAICLLIAAGIKAWIDLAKKKTETEGKVKLKKEEREQLGREEILRQYNELQREFKQVMTQLEQIQTEMVEIRSTFDILLPFLEKAINDNPELKNAVNKAFAKLKINQS